LSRLLAFYRSNNPFDVAYGELHSLYSGVIASDEDKVSCDQAKSVGRCIMERMDNEIVINVVLKKADRAKTLSQVSKMVVADKHLKVDSNLLFSRLIIIAQRCDDIEPIFCHELTAVPAAFFKDGMMHETAKSLLAKELKGAVKLRVCNSTVPLNYVVDGGWLLHKVKWQSVGTYDDVLDQYVHYVCRYFGSKATIVFDGYGNGPTTKDQEHNRRSVKTAPNILLMALQKLMAT